MKYFLPAFFILMLLGCVTTNDVDVTQFEPTCAQPCIRFCSDCISDASAGHRTVLLHQCKQAMKECLQTCTPKS